jgi:hypothetical protein
MAGFFSKFGKQMDELASAAAEKASELKETASEKIEELTKDQLYIFVLDNNNEKIKITGTKDEIFNFLMENDFIKEYNKKKDEDG